MIIPPDRVARIMISPASTASYTSCMRSSSYFRTLAGIGAVIRVLGIVSLTFMDNKILESQKWGIAPIIAVQPECPE
jgi:hypothetical protein